MNIIIFLILGALAGWLAGVLTRGAGFGIVVNILVGIVGAVIGSWVFGLLGMTAYGFWGEFATATVGAVILLLILSAFRPHGSHRHVH